MFFGKFFSIKLGKANLKSTPYNFRGLVKLKYAQGLLKMNEQDLEIIPGERIGPYYLKWDIETLKKHLPTNYVVYDYTYTWGIEFNEYYIHIRKIDNQINSIAVLGKFRQHFKHQITCNSTLEQIENIFGPTKDVTIYDILPNYPGMELYFGDEDENDESDDSWKNLKIECIAICDPNFIWDEHYTKEDYKNMKENKFPFPFPKEKFVKK